MKKLSAAGISLLCLMFVSGCMIIADNDFDHDKCGITKDARRVGGGLEITYIASEDGVVNLIDRKSCKSLMSKTIIAGEKYEFQARALDAQEEKKWGIDIKKADFVLYFYPTHPKHPIHGQPPVCPQPPAPPAPPAPPQPAQ